jgi:membrane protein DedA with SNARE-associated domain
LTHLLLSYGLVLLFGLVAMESAGIPLPGETALVAAAVLASQGHYSIVAVIAVAATGAIVGDNVGYWIGREGGRALLERTPFVRDYFERVLPPAERFFKRHGSKTIFFARFFAVLRVTAAWVAGISRMHWWRFFLWNAAGGIVWALLVGLVAYELGHAAADAINRYGLYAGIAIVLLLVAGFLVFKFWGKRIFRHLHGSSETG